MRLDKFLKVSRIIKRRTVAKDAVLNGYIKLNGTPAKPGSEVKIGDVISFESSRGNSRFVVVGLTQKDEAYVRMANEDE
ncbi:MAG: S4 domain-containing protein [Ezakiella sp.]|uniref:S4 domain-containing protein n=1 Tax=Ezakiella sp. TaxID=1935205 RepID=UPI002976E96F|nr:S4 domain-containing protein [Ezakiella sp.]MDD7731957.1 S4 domain-containing protein [Eubacteriales bacterium]MDY6079589.1 S4 domain-containing protein [Ezakiella sp.]